MAAVSVDRATGVLVKDGRKLFPLCLSNGPPRAGKAPNGRNGLAEVAAAGVNMIRSGNATWGAETTPGLIAVEKEVLAAAAAHGLVGWVWLGDLTDLPPPPNPRQPPGGGGRR